MATYRVYVDKKIVKDKKGIETGGDHSRVIDLEAASSEAAHKQTARQLKRDEAVNQVVETRV